MKPQILQYQFSEQIMFLLKPPPIRAGSDGIIFAGQRAIAAGSVGQSRGLGR